MAMCSFSSNSWSLLFLFLSCDLGLPTNTTLRHTHTSLLSLVLSMVESFCVLCVIRALMKLESLGILLLRLHLLSVTHWILFVSELQFSYCKTGIKVS